MRQELLKKKQKLATVFFHIMSSGWACGLEHPLDCYENYLRQLYYMAPASQFPEIETEAVEAMALFFRCSACCPEEDDEFEHLTDEELLIKMNMWYQELQRPNDPKLLGREVDQIVFDEFNPPV